MKSYWYVSNHESSLFNIDLNAEIFNQEIDKGDVQQQNSNEMHHLPDLNINVAQNIDLNLIWCGLAWEPWRTINTWEPTGVPMAF